MPKAATRYRKRNRSRQTRRRRGGGRLIPQGKGYNIGNQSRNGSNSTDNDKVAPEPAPAPAKLDCDAEGLNLYMREATFGRNYKVLIGHIHDDGEKWKFDQLKDLLYDGMLEWYSRQLHTEATFPSLKNIPEVGILSAFFYRYKVVAERLSAVRRILRAGPANILHTARNYTGPASFRRYLDESPKVHPIIVKNFRELIPYAENLEEEAAKDLPIEIAIDRAQCILFYTVKHGKLPEGFVMDPRIEARAREPININKSVADLVTVAALPKIDAMLGWLKFQNEAQRELAEPEVTFGVF